MDIYLDHKSLQYVFTQKKLKLWWSRWLKLLKNYDMSLHYHPSKTNMVANSLSRLSMGRLSHVNEGKRVLVRDIGWLTWEFFF